MSRQTANHVPRSFRIFSKHPSDISQTYCNLIPGQLRAKSSKSSKSQVPREAYSSHLLIGPFRSTPTYPESRALTQRHIYFLSLSLSLTSTKPVTARRGQAGMGPAGPSLEEASCGASLVGRLYQKGLMLPTGSWERKKEWPALG